MIITCPACSARFNVADHLIGTQGRVVRCAKCGHKWQQMPDGQVAAPPPPPPPPPPAAPPPSAAEPSVPRSTPATKGRIASPLPKLGDIPLEMPAQGVGGGGGHVEPQHEDVDLAAALDRVAGVVAESDAQNAFQSVAAKPGEVGSDTDGGQMPGGDFDFGEAEPIPEVFTQQPGGAPQGGAKGKSKALGLVLFLLTIIVVLGGVVAAAFFMRAKVVELYPDAAGIYEALGIDAEALGAGLKFRNVTSERVIENNVEVLVVRGVVANISDKPRDLPMIKLSLYDAGNVVVQDKVMPPPEVSLPPNESTGFKIGIESPAAAARRFEVTFAPKPQE